MAPTFPAAVAQNVSEVEAVIERVENTDESHQNVALFIVSSKPVNGRVSILEASQRIVAAVQYVRDAVGNIDAENPYNKRLGRLKTMQTGQSIRGKVALNRQGGWVLIDIDEK